MIELKKPAPTWEENPSDAGTIARVLEAQLITRDCFDFMAIKGYKLNLVTGEYEKEEANA